MKGLFSAVRRTAIRPAGTARCFARNIRSPELLSLRGQRAYARLVHSSIRHCTLLQRDDDDDDHYEYDYEEDD